MSEGFLAHVYDAVKAHEYYMKNRQLKGRKPGLPDSPGGRTITKAEFKRAATGNEGKYARPQHQAEARAQARQRLEDLENRLDRLRNLLQERVEAAKKRSGVSDGSSTDKSRKSNATADSQSSTDKSGGKNDSKLTAKEKRDAAERARKSYEKNHKGKPSEAKDPSVAEQIEDLEKKIWEIRQQLKEATANARKKSEAQSKNKTESNKGRRQ